MAIQSTPQRRTQRKTHLDASVVPVERALLAHAESVKNSQDEFEMIGAELTDKSGLSRDSFKADIQMMVCEVVAAVLTDLAEELHWW